jgi:hypothetical protein
MMSARQHHNANAAKVSTAKSAAVPWADCCNVSGHAGTGHKIAQHPYLLCIHWHKTTNTLTNTIKPQQEALGI